MPDRIWVRRHPLSLGDMIDDIAHRPCPGTGISVSYVIDEVVVLLLAEHWWSSVHPLCYSLCDACCVVPPDRTLVDAEHSSDQK
jgi:hypothetical protein